MDINDLVQAIRDKDWVLALSLLEKVPDLNLEDEFGSTPLMRSLRSWQQSYFDNQAYFDLLIALLSKGAKLNREGRDYIMVSGLPVKIIEHAYKCKRIKFTKNSLSQFLYHSKSADSQIDFIKFLATTDFPLTADIMGIAMADALPNHQMGAGLHGYGKTIAANLIPVFDYLISIGADVNAKSQLGPENYRGHTVLMRASMNCCTELCEYLIHKGADINAQSERGYTALMFASGKIYNDCVWRPRDEDLVIIKQLVQAGADKELKSNSNKTALAYAKSSKHVAALALLR